MCIRDSALEKLAFDELRLQVGRGAAPHLPAASTVNNTHVSWFRFTRDLPGEMARAHIVVSHAGAGSILEALELKRRLVVVPNGALMDDHQAELAGALAADRHLVAAPGPAGLCDALAAAVVAPALRLLPLANARVVVVGVTRPLPRRAPLVARDNAPDTMEVADIAVKPVKEFAKDSYRLIRKCTKPDRKEFSKIATRTGMGFIVMGFVGFFVKLILYVCHARFLALSSRARQKKKTAVSRFPITS